MYVQNIINSVHAYDPNIKILIHTVTPQPIGDKFIATTYNIRNNYEAEKYNQELWNDMILSFDNPAENIYVIPTAAHFDTRNSTKTAVYNTDKFTPTFSEVLTDDVHPLPSGAQYIADAYYQAIYNLVLHA